jgi:hypothetical protein
VKTISITCNRCNTEIVNDLEREDYGDQRYTFGYTALVTTGVGDSCFKPDAAAAVHLCPDCFQAFTRFLADGAK